MKYLKRKLVDWFFKPLLAERIQLMGIQERVGALALTSMSISGAQHMLDKTLENMLERLAREMLAKNLIVFERTEDKETSDTIIRLLVKVWK